MVRFNKFWLVTAKIRSVWSHTANAFKRENTARKIAVASPAKTSFKAKRETWPCRSLNQATRSPFVHAKRQSATKSTVHAMPLELNAGSTVPAKTASIATKTPWWTSRFTKAKRNRTTKTQKCLKEWVSNRLSLNEPF